MSTDRGETLRDQPRRWKRDALHKEHFDSPGRSILSGLRRYLSCVHNALDPPPEVPMRRIVSLLMFASAASFFASAAPADSCHGPSAPGKFPEPTTASEQDILAAQQSVKRYLTDMESVLKCMDGQHDADARNLAVDDMEKTAAKFNTVLRAFRARQKT
jgi:hypothetical protein